MVCSVGAAALEDFEHHIPHRTDVCLDALQPVGIGLAVFGALLVDAVALGYTSQCKSALRFRVLSRPAIDSVARSLRQYLLRHGVMDALD